MNKKEIKSVNQLADLNLEELALTDVKSNDLLIHIYERPETIAKDGFLICTISEADVRGRMVLLTSKSILFSSVKNMEMSKKEITYNSKKDYMNHYFYALPYSVFPEYFI